MSHLRKSTIIRKDYDKMRNKVIRVLIIGEEAEIGEKENRISEAKKPI